jgi:hypothetical protein
MSFDGLKAALRAEASLVQDRLTEDGSQTVADFTISNNDGQDVAGIQIVGFDEGVTLVTLQPVLTDIHHYDAFRFAEWRHPEDDAIVVGWDHPKGWTKYFHTDSAAIAEEVVRLLRQAYTVDAFPYYRGH